MIVFPDGFGFSWLGHSSASEDAVLSKLRVQRGPAGLIRSSRTAVRLLAAASGVELAVPSSGSRSSRYRDRLVIALGVVGGLALTALVRFALRRR